MRALRMGVAGVVLAVAAGFACAESFDVPPELWDRPRTGAAILANDGVRSAVTALLAQPESAELVIHHAPEQEPLMQAEELRTWLTALAIDTRRIRLRGDLAAGAPLRLEVFP